MLIFNVLGFAFLGLGVIVGFLTRLILDPHSVVFQDSAACTHQWLHWIPLGVAAAGSDLLYRKRGSLRLGVNDFDRWFGPETGGSVFFLPVWLWGLVVVVWSFLVAVR
jgi:hypothetical protein